MEGEESHVEGTENLLGEKVAKKGSKSWERHGHAGTGDTENPKQMRPQKELLHSILNCQKYRTKKY